GQPATPGGAPAGGQPAAPGAAPADQPGQGAARGGRGGFGGPAAPPIVGYPRGYSVQTSLDGTTWSKPVAEGKGDGARTIIAFAPTRARFLRITQTDTVEAAPNWSVNNLRIYEAPPASASK
ncbi:MAG: discoidin domain-containing protein, partial [Acidobacteriota bacterium]